MITSYEIVIRDATALSKIGWKFIIIDEGHRLKNMNCRLIRELKRICGSDMQGASGCNRLLLTGTPSYGEKGGGRGRDWEMGRDARRHAAATTARLDETPWLIGAMAVTQARRCRTT